MENGKPVQMPAKKRKVEENSINAKSASNSKPPHPKHHPIQLHAEVYVLADRYGIDGLKALALKKFSCAWETAWDAHAMIAAARLASDWTKETDKGLRDEVVRAIYEFRTTIFKDEKCKEALRKMGSIVTELATMLIFPPTGVYYY